MINDKLLGIELSIYANGETSLISTLNDFTHIPNYIFELKHHLEEELKNTFIRVLQETKNKDYFIGADI